MVLYRLGTRPLQISRSIHVHTLRVFSFRLFWFFDGYRLAKLDRTALRVPYRVSRMYNFIKFLQHSS